MNFDSARRLVLDAIGKVSNQPSRKTKLAALFQTKSQLNAFVRRLAALLTLSAPSKKALEGVTNDSTVGDVIAIVRNRGNRPRPTQVVKQATAKKATKALTKKPSKKAPAKKAAKRTSIRRCGTGSTKTPKKPIRMGGDEKVLPTAEAGKKSFAKKSVKKAAKKATKWTYTKKSSNRKVIKKSVKGAVRRSEDQEKRMQPGRQPVTPKGNVTRLGPSFPFSLVRVFYATDREQISTSEGIDFTAKRSDYGALHFGECNISIPDTHKIGRVESPSILRLEYFPDPERHIILQTIENLDEQMFFRKVADSIAKAPARDAFVFIHGYNVSFEDAARRTGQIAFDLDFIGAPVFYSWPSNGKLADYPADEANIIWTAPHFERFLELLSQYGGAKRIHIIAHSMGNRAVCDALKHVKRTGSRMKFNHLVLAAPDIDADTFRELADNLTGLSERVTLYESSKDKAIKASRKFHQNPRAGEPLLIIKGLDTVDASKVDTDFLGHSYFGDSWPLLSDIHSILSKDDHPRDRFGLREIEHVDGLYYEFVRS